MSTAHARTCADKGSPADKKILLKILVGRYVLLHKTKPSTCEDKVRLFYAIKTMYHRLVLISSKFISTKLNGYLTVHIFIMFFNLFLLIKFTFELSQYI